MVDFQSRDTRRGPDDDDEEGGDDPDTESETADEADAATEPADPEPDDEPADAHEHGDDGAHSHDDHADGDHSHGHDHHAHDVEALGIGVVTISSSRSRDDDPSGDTIVSGVENAGHEVAVRDVVRDDHDGIQQAIDALVGRRDVDVLITTGGTGVTPDDVTIEAVEPLLDKELPGFGELFRLLSHDEIGTKVVGTRATAGIAEGVPVFCLPGSENAVSLGVEEIILEEAPHLAGLATRE